MRFNAQAQMIAWTTVLVTGLGSLAMAFMLQPPKGVHDGKQNRTSPLAASSPTGGDQRAPASTQDQNAKAVSLDAESTKQAVDLTLPCKGDMKSRFNHSVTQVRLIGQTCLPGRALSSEILNDANGSSATVFYPSERTYTTDYIALAPGPNRIRIVHSLDKGGREEREYLIEREKQ